MKQERDDFCRLHQLDIAQQTILHHLCYEPPRLAIHAAENARLWAGYTRFPVLELDDYKDALADLVDREFVVSIDHDAQSEIQEYMDSDPAHGSTHAMPSLGTLQYTIRYARLLDGFTRNNQYDYGPTWSIEWQSDKHEFVYGTSRQECFNYLRDELSDDSDESDEIERVSGPVHCGPWRTKWWFKYSDGYILEVFYV